MLPQVDGDVLAHSLSGSVPAGMAAQVPSAPAALHCSQVPVQAVLQQTPSTQKPLEQVAPAAQVDPCGQAQTPLLHEPLVQSPFAAQAWPEEHDGQAPPPQSSRSRRRS